MTDNLYWIWLSLVCGAGGTAGEILLEYFKTPEDIFHASEAELRNIKELQSKKDILFSLCKKDLEEAETILAYCSENKIGLLPLEDPHYPKRLKNIRQKPLLLYFKGNFPLFDDNVCVAMVGTRRMSPYGRRSAYTIAYDLAKAGAIIISGMALGVDTMCHTGCLDAGGRTIAVLGCGIDQVYPPENQPLMNRILQNGAILTEYKPKTPPIGRHFPVRNRIISGLCQATMVIEADLRSGALITAKTALYQGRNIYALPGKAGELNSTGTNKLIKEGAKMVTAASDILQEYENLYPHRIHSSAKELQFSPVSSVKAALRVAANQNLPKGKEILIPKEIAKETAEPIELTAWIPHATEVHTAIYAALSYTCGMTYDEIARKGFPISDVMTVMTDFEIANAVTSLPGGVFVKQKLKAIPNKNR